MVLRIERRRSPAVAMKMVVMAALQRVRGVVACRGGRGRRDGARRHSEGSRGRRWPRRYGGAAAAALGLERERERKRGRVRERVRERSGLRGIVRAVAREAVEEAGGGQARADVPRPRALSIGVGRKTIGEGQVGWAGHLGRQVAAQVSWAR